MNDKLVAGLLGLLQTHLPQSPCTFTECAVDLHYISQGSVAKIEMQGSL